MTVSASASPSATDRVRLVFDRDSCGRCGGTGRYAGYGVCFACSGAGGRLTRAGLAASKRWRVWKDANLSLPIDATLVGRRAFIPQQFAGPDNGGTFMTFKGEHTVTAVEPRTDGSAVDVTFSINLGTARRPWLDYDPAARTLRVMMTPRTPTAVSSMLYRAPTREELERVLPTLGAGARLERIPPK